MIISKKQYLFIPIYKSILFRSCKFETNSNDIQDKIIINALNIKNRKKRIEYVYDSTCDYIDNYYNHENICGFKNRQCYVQQAKKTNSKYGCCRKCKYVTDTGCPTKNLACKLFNCSKVLCKKRIIKYKDLKTLKILSLRQRFIVKSDYFSLREDILKDLYTNSIILSTIRIAFRLIKNLIV